MSADLQQAALEYQTAVREYRRLRVLRDDTARRLDELEQSCGEAEHTMRVAGASLCEVARRDS